jgi:hypothetical protein
MKKIIVILPLFLLTCSDAPKVALPEPTNRVVLAEFFTHDG